MVLHEQYRELELNQAFAAYATAAGFRIHACEGYDPESKGKVEAGVKYVKGNALAGEVFDDWGHLEAHVRQWLDEVANIRRHGTTGEAPQVRFECDEQAQLGPYLTPGPGDHGQVEQSPSKMPGVQDTQSGILRDQTTRCTSELNPRTSSWPDHCQALNLPATGLTLKT